MSATSSLGILFIQESQNNKYLTANTAFQGFDSAANAEAAFALTDVATAITLTQAQMASAMVLKLTGALTAARNVIVPAIPRFFVIFNASTGGFAVTVKTAGGTGISVGNGLYVVLFCDGTNVVQISAGSSSGPVPNFADAETPGGTINGSNTAFTLAFAPSPAASLQLFLNGQLLKPGGVDYTLSGLNITMVTAPVSTPVADVLLAWYRH